MLIEIKKILPFAANKIGLGKIYDFNQVFVNWDKIICHSLDENYKNKSKPISLKNRVLLVDCLNPVWAQDLQLKQPRLVEEINKFLKKDLVGEIRFIS